MVSNTSPLKLEANRQDWALLAVVVWAVVFIAWMSHISRCFPNYSVDPSQTVRFSELMAAQSRPASLIYNPLVVFFVFNVGVIGLAILTELRLLLLTLLANPVMCLILAASVFCIGFTQLSHLESVKFDGRTYHLIEATTDDWDLPNYSLQLYECDLSGELCRGQSIYARPDFIKPGDVSMVVDSATNTLNISFRDSVVFTVEGLLSPR